MLRNHLRGQARRRAASLNGRDHPAATDLALEQREQAERVAQALAVGVPRTIEWMRDVYVEKKGLVNLESYL